LLRHAESLDTGRRGEVSSSTVDDYGIDRSTPAETRKQQMSPEFWESQEQMRVEKNFKPKKYADVLSEFEGEVDIGASQETCYALWNDPGALRRFVPGLEVAKATSFFGNDLKAVKTAECELFYQFGSARTNELESLRFIMCAVEHETHKKIHWQSTDGFPCGAVVSFSSAPENKNETEKKTTARLEFYCHLPYDLALKEGAMRVSLDVEERLAECLSKFAVVAQTVEEKGGVSAMQSDADAKVYLGENVVPCGFGLDKFHEADASVSKIAMEQAAFLVRQRVGRTPFTSEVLKEMRKGK